MIQYTREVCYLDDGDVAVLTPGGVQVYDSLGQPEEKERSHVDWEISAAEKGGYEHFMFKEIMEEPKALKDTISPRIRDGKVVLDDLTITREDLEGMDRFYIIACGSSYHVGMAAKYILERLLRIPVEVTLASEFPVLPAHCVGAYPGPGHQPVGGRPSTPWPPCGRPKRLGAPAAVHRQRGGLHHRPGVDDVLYTWAGPEIAVATTKAYSTQLAVIYLLAIHFAGLLGRIGSEEYRELVEQLQLLPGKAEEILKHTEEIQYYASIYFNHDSVFFIGRNIDYAVGLEGSLKLKEISYIHSEAYAAGELKHGTISLIEDGTLVVALASWNELFDKLMSNVKEVKARGADVIGIATESHKAALAALVDSALSIPDIHPHVPALSGGHPHAAVRLLCGPHAGLRHR